MATTMNGGESDAISKQHIGQYAEDGAICLRGMVGMAWIERLREATERVLATRAQTFAAKGATGSFRADLDMWLRDSEFQAFALEGPTGQIAKSLMRSKNLQLFSDQLFVKEPGTSTPSPWHQDQTYWPFWGDQVCSVWVAMDAVSKETSGLEYVRGSHLWARRFRPGAWGERDMSALGMPTDEPIPDFDANRDSYDFLSWDMEPGDVLVHSGFAVHGAGGNRSQTARRRAVATRWLGDDVRYRPVSLFTEALTGLSAGDPVANSKILFPPVPLPAGRALPHDYWPAANPLSEISTQADQPASR